jgi:alkaline phosphatase D
VTDAWAGFASEKASLLEALHSVPNVIILSGDRHEFAAIEFNSKEDRNPILEFSTSPLSMFYVPFIRTLRMRSDEVVRTMRTQNKPNIEGIEDTVAMVEEIPRERVLKYIASGNYKW